MSLPAGSGRCEATGMDGFVIAPYSPLSSAREAVLIGLQGLQVAFLAVHDWVPLGRLNDVAAVRGQDSRGRLVAVTMIQTVPFGFGLVWSVLDFGRAYPGWLMRWLFFSYLILLVGQLRAWWVPYLVRAEPERAAAVSGDVCGDALVFAGAAWDCAEYGACDVAFGDGGDSGGAGGAVTGSQSSGRSISARSNCRRQL